MESNDELLVSDDNSSDDTMGILKEYSDTRIIVFKNNFNSVNKNFEFLISKAKRDFIFLSDQDDLWMNNKIKICKINLVSNTLVLSDAKVIFNEKTIIKPIFRFRKIRKTLLVNLYKNSFMGCCMAFRKELVEQIHFQKIHPCMIFG